MSNNSLSINESTITPQTNSINYHSRENSEPNSIYSVNNYGLISPQLSIKSDVIYLFFKL